MLALNWSQTAGTVLAEDDVFDDSVDDFEEDAELDEEDEQDEDEYEEYDDYADSWEEPRRRIGRMDDDD